MELADVALATALFILLDLAHTSYSEPTHLHFNQPCVPPYNPAIAATSPWVLELVLPILLTSH